MNPLKKWMGLGAAVALSWNVAGYAQTNLPKVSRAQICQNIEIVENVLNTVRQQVLTSSLASKSQSAMASPDVFYLRTTDSNRTEGIYLDGYGVIFEVYMPTFSEQRSYSLFLHARSPLEVSTGQEIASQPGIKSVTVQSMKQPPPATLNKLAGLIDSYSKETQSQNREAALRELFAKIQAANLFPSFGFLEYGESGPASDGDAQRAVNEAARLNEQRQQFQDAIMQAIAEYGATIPGLPPTESITVFLKAPVSQDFSLFSPVTRTSKIIRFSVRDLQDYKVGKINYEELQKRVKIEEN